MVSLCSCVATEPAYSLRTGAYAALAALVAACQTELPRDAFRQVRKASFVSPSSKGDRPVFPCPLKEHEVVAALKALEGCVASTIADLRFGSSSRAITVDMRKVAGFLMSSYITTVAGFTKADPKVSEKLIGASTLAPLALPCTSMRLIESLQD